MKQKMYRKGEPFQSVDELTRWMYSGKWLYWRDIPKHPSIIKNMSFGTVIHSMGRGTILPAIKTKEDE